MISNEEKILNYIDNNKEKIITFLKELIRRPSMVGQESKIQDFIAKKMQDLNMTIDLWYPKVDDLMKSNLTILDKKLYEVGYENRPILVGILKGNGNGKSLILNGHVDVVSPEPLSEWKYDPWSAIESQGKIYGRGAADMKGGVAAMIMAVESIIKSGIKLNGDILVESVIDEERFDGAGTLACVLKGYKADAALLLEPSDLEFTVVHTGISRFKVKVIGKAAHACLKHEGISAIEKIIKIYNAIRDLEVYREGKSEHPFISHSYFKTISPIVIGTLNAGTWSSTVPDKAELTCRLSVMPHESVDEVFNEFIEQIKYASLTDPWLRNHIPEVEIMSGYESAEIDVDHAIVKAAERSFIKVMGNKPKYRGVPGGADARLLTNHADTPTLHFGPGVTHTCHSPNEYTEIQQVLDVTKVTALTILDWCK